MKPVSKHELVNERTRHYELTAVMKRNIVSQLNGSMDAVRARAFWRIHLPALAESEGAEQMAEALVDALNEVRVKLSKPLIG
ncbi:hypothetical protein [Aeromonas caviae]|uniref:hypothetical protein n=1 Tax=Aeromonas caviae TaxID=648 RepID=UPI000FEB702C|nr:hypothetical protein [Aeromonas caviae]RWT41911.1 hypothetical protein DN613_04585 [Aeromonas caviae]